MAKTSKMTAGVTSLASQLSQASNGERIQKLPVSAICPDPDQPRKSMDADAIKTLAASIKAEGQLQPIVVRTAPAGADAQYMIVFGERRWRAVKENGDGTIDAVVREYADDELPDVLATQFIENYEREEMTPTDQVNAIGRLAAQIGNKKVAEKTGRPASWVSKMVAIYKGGDATQRALSGAVTRDTESLYELAKLEKKHPHTAEHLVDGWLAYPQQTQDVRGQIKAAVESMNAPQGAGDDTGGATGKEKQDKQPNPTTKKNTKQTSETDDVYRCHSAKEEGDLIVIDTNFGLVVFDASLKDAIKAL